MKVSLQNIIEFEFTSNPTYGIQRIRMTPKMSERQKILNWEIILKGAKQENEYVDHHGNVCVLLTFEKDTKSVSVLAQGDVEINKTNGVINDDSLIPNWLFKRHTELAKPGMAIKKFCRDFAVFSGSDLDLVYKVANKLKQTLKYEIGSTKIETAAEEAFLLKKGVCQDFAHIYISCMRLLNFPARYVSGYLKLDDRKEQEATHAWTEVYLPGAGWRGFDPSAGGEITERYIVLASSSKPDLTAAVCGTFNGPPGTVSELSWLIEAMVESEAGQDHQPSLIQAA